jgi:hypothetical protein
MGSSATIAAWVLTGTASLSAVYSWFLNSIHHIYAPNWIWVTVVGGNALIGGMLALWLWLDPVQAGAIFQPFWRLLALNIAAGIPIIAWQIWQAAQRPSNVRR